jgi:hypothetical protein
MEFQLLQGLEDVSKRSTDIRKTEERRRSKDTTNKKQENIAMG